MVNMVQMETTSPNILLIKATNTVIGGTNIVVYTHKEIEPLQCHSSIQTYVYSFKLIDLMAKIFWTTATLKGQGGVQAVQQN